MDSAAAVNPGADQTAPAGLSDLEFEILGFEKQWWQYPGTKEKAVRERFALSPTRYYQLLNELIDKQAALAAEPLLVRRLRRLRAARQKARSARRFGIEL
jgi:Protein of unknown function (DUF3263)